MADISNEQIVWEIERPARSFPDLKLGPHFRPRGGRGTPSQILAPNDPIEGIVWPPSARHRPFPAAALARPLLTALEDPDRWIAAHVVLSRLHNVNDSAFEIGSDGDTFVYTYNGVRTELRAEGGRHGFSYSPSYGDDFFVQSCAARIDPAQRAAVREQWHRRLDVPVCSVAHWQAALASPDYSQSPIALPASVWLTAFVTKR